MLFLKGEAFIKVSQEFTNSSFLEDSCLDNRKVSLSLTIYLIYLIQ